MDSDIKPLTAAEFKAQRQQTVVSVEKTKRFNEIMQRAMTEPVSSEVLAYLRFEDFGYDYTDIAFVEDAGFKISRNRACLWWEVSLAD